MFLLLPFLLLIEIGVYQIGLPKPYLMPALCNQPWPLLSLGLIFASPRPAARISYLDWSSIMSKQETLVYHPNPKEKKNNSHLHTAHT